MHMRMLPVLVAAMLMSPPAIERGAAQSGAASADKALRSLTEGIESPAEAATPPVPDAAAAAGSSSGPAAPAPVLPVSLDRIRDALNKPVDPRLLRMTELPVDFRIQVVEQRKIDEMLSKLNFDGGPVPAGGLYSFEQQRRLFRPTDRPLMQPYAAYNGGQLITVALENLIAKYLGGRLSDAITGLARSRAEHEARHEVDEAIAVYCSSRPDRADIQLCTGTDR
jgi:hypothetical protein